MSSKRDLEEQIRQLRHELKQHERRLKVLGEKDQEARGLKRRQSDDLRSSSKRLRSAVTVVDSNAPPSGDAAPAEVGI